MHSLAIQPIFRIPVTTYLTTIPLYLSTLPCMLHNLRKDLTILKHTLDLLWQCILLEITLITRRDRNVDTTSLGSDDLDDVHTLFREVDLSRIGGIDLYGGHGSGDLDFEGW